MTAQIIASVSQLILNIAQFFGQILIFVSTFLVQVSEYSDFETEEFVITGWTAVRDVANMFFIIVLLVIAIATILRIEQYSARRLLFKLLLMALLINFSKSIVGFIIEVSQVIMLFFVAAYQGGVEGVLLKNLLHMDQLLDITRRTGVETIQFRDILGVVIGATLMLIVAIVTVGVVVAVLLFRIVALWILIIFSPLVFLLHAVPAGVKYASQWWGMFTKYVITGPILAFFLYIAFSAVGQDRATKLLQPSSPGKAGLAGVSTARPDAQIGERAAEGLISVGSSISAFFQADTLFAFMVGIALLIGALWATSQLGVMGGSMATKAIGQLQTRGAAAGKGLVRYAGRQSYVTPLARRAGFAAKRLVEQVPLARNLTAAGRQQAALKKQAGKRTQFFGGTQAKADLASMRAKFLKAKEKEMDERGLTTEPGIMRTQLNSSTDPIEREVLVSKLLSQEVPDSEDLVHDFFNDKRQFKYNLQELRSMSPEDLKKSKEAQQQMSIFSNLESKIKDKTYTSYSAKADEKGDILFKTPTDYLRDRQKKRSSLGREDFKKETFNMVKNAKDSSRDIEDVEVDIENFEMINPSDEKVQFDNENMSNITDAIAATVERLKIERGRATGADQVRIDGQIEQLVKKYDSLRMQYRGTGDRPERAADRMAVSVSAPVNITNMQKTKARIDSARSNLQSLRNSGSTDEPRINAEIGAFKNSTQQMYAQLKKEGFDTGALDKEVENIRQLSENMTNWMAEEKVTHDDAMRQIIEKSVDFDSHLPDLT